MHACGSHYGEPIEWRFEPHVAEQVFVEMPAEAKVSRIAKAKLRDHKAVLSLP